MDRVALGGIRTKVQWLEIPALRTGGPHSPAWGAGPVPAWTSACWWRVSSYIRPHPKTLKNARGGWYRTEGKEIQNFWIPRTQVRSIKLLILIFTDDQMHTRCMSACSNITSSSPKMSDGSGKCPHQSTRESHVGGEPPSDVWMESVESQIVWITTESQHKGHQREGKKIEDLSIGICGNNSQFNMRLPHSLLMPGLPGEEVGL